MARKQPNEALAVLDESLTLLDSPNTRLLRAHALRDLGRKAEAMEVYHLVERQAGDKVRAGEQRFRPTLAEAGRHIALLKIELGQVEVRDVPSGAEVSLAGRKLEPVSGQVLAWSAAGPSLVVLRSDDGREKSADIEVKPGEVTSVTLALPAPAPVPVAPPAPSELPPPDSDEPDGEPTAGPPVHAWIAGGLGLLGFGLFAGLGASSAATASDLEACAPRCPESLRGDADEAATQQLVANVGLGVGIAGVTAFGVLWLVDALTGDGDGEGADESVAIGPGAIRVAF